MRKMSGGQPCVIQLPHSLIPEGSNFSLDIGGSLAKVAYVPRTLVRNKCKFVHLYLMTFDTEHLDRCLDYIRREVIGQNNHVGRCVRATGVSCVKFSQKICDELGVKLQVDCHEMAYMAKGMDTLWRILPPDKLLHTGSDASGCNFHCPLVDSGLLPCLLVSLGSAMTIIQVDASGATSGVIGGSSQGGLTFLGLGALLTSAKTFEELVELAERGDRRSVDLLVKDTAGETEYNAGSDDMVSSFGKAAKLRAADPDCQFKEADIASSLLFSITDQLAQTAYLVAKSQNIHRVAFCGSYLANQTIIQQIQGKFVRSVQYLNHEVSPVFLRHEAYLGAIGLLFGDSLCHDGIHQQQDTDQKS